MLLLHAPVAKPCEPPAGIAKLAGCLSSHSYPCAVADLNLEGLLYLLSTQTKVQDTWSKRAQKNLARNLTAIQSAELYTNFSRYQKSVLELNRLLEIAGSATITTSLANYQDSDLSPLSISDLLKISEKPDLSIFSTFFYKRIPELLEKHSPEFIGISINYLSQALSSFALIGVINEIAPEIKIVIGGGLITSWMRKPDWQNPFSGVIDLCIDGCGEEPLLRLLGSKRRKDSLPDYSMLAQNEYFSPGFILPYSASTGCFWNKCDFCPELAENAPYRAHPPEKVIEDLHILIQQNRPSLLHFLDNAIAPALLKELIESQLGTPWYGFARVTEHLTRPDFCEGLRRSGCIMLKLGIESGDQGVLDQMQKGLDIATISSALECLHNAGIATYVYLLFGTPAESEIEARRTLEFVNKHHKQIDFLNLAIFNMPINSRDKILDRASFYQGDLSLYTDFHHPLGWNRKRVRKFLDQDFKRQPKIAKIIRRDPVIFTSNHAPFFCDIGSF